VEKVGKIVNNAHWKRLVRLIASTKGKIIVGGTGDEMARFIEPTIIIDVPEEDPVVQTEIFGPIFPVMKYSSTSDRARLLQKLSPDALALYVFTEDLEEADLIVKTSTTGTASINDCMAQIAPTSLQFGGFGKSGTGAYRGKASIDTFSHKQATVTVPTSPEFEELQGWRYPYAESSKTVEFVKKNLERKLS
jgi:acyl-CoA reductase-like NAD-dependent aldehyde dehydrogenase